jgi:hypothetical protein
MLIRRSVDADLPALLTIINDAARAYRGVIPTDRWHEPYMSAGELAKEIADGGTWASASWAVDFYVRNGFSLLPTSESSRLLKTYWSIPARQVETSVVLANGRWMESQERVR